MGAGPKKSKEYVFWIETDKIVPNPMQPRHLFDEESIQNLAASVREYGILQPIVVSRVEKEVQNGTEVQYEIIAGERRFRAAKMLGLSEVPALVRREETTKVKLELAIVENLQREDLNPIDKALAFQRLISDFNMMQREIADRIGKSREVVANSVRLLNLPQNLKDAISQGYISEGHARPLLTLNKFPEEQDRLYQLIIDKRISVRDAERISREYVTKHGPEYKKPGDPETREVADKLENILGAKVSIYKDRKGKGRISIEFFSEEELRGIANKIEEKETSGDSLDFTSADDIEIQDPPEYAFNDDDKDDLAEDSSNEGKSNDAVDRFSL